MKRSFFSKSDNEDERKMALVVGAAVAVHGILASGIPRASHIALVHEAFNIAEEFLRVAEEKCGP